MSGKKYIIPHNYDLTVEHRTLLMGHPPAVVWFTGLSGSGKSTLANHLETYLFEKKIHTYLLDGDNVRAGLCSDLDFSEASRKENIRRIGEVSKLMADAGLVVLSAFVSPFANDRNFVRSRVGNDRFIEVFVDCPIEICEKRDVKGLYAKARQGLIKDFTGINSPFEAPENPDVHLRSDLEPAEKSLEKIIETLVERKVLRE